MRKISLVVLLALVASVVLTSEPIARAQTISENDSTVTLGDGSTITVEDSGDQVGATATAERSHNTVSPAGPADPDAHCAEWVQEPVYGPGTVAVTAADGDDGGDALDPNRHPDQDILDVIIANRNGPSSRTADGAIKDYSSLPAAVEAPDKVAKSATSRSSSRMLMQHDTVDAEATTQLLLDIQAQEEADAAAAAAGGGGGGGGGQVIVGYVDVCVLHYVCGGERIDDVLAGQISNETPGAFAEYVLYISAIVSSVGAIVFGGIDVDNGSIANTVADGGLGDPASSTAMPVFYFCRRGPGGDIEITNPGYDPSFGWDTNVFDNFDVPGARFNLRQTLIAKLDGELPETQTIPPIELGYTFVKVPMWMWLIEPFEFTAFYAQNDLGTVRIANRATLVDVTFDIGGTSYTCTLDELQEFVHGTDSIADTAPKCSHQFLQLQDFTITATTRYFIEEQIAYRSPSSPWPTGGWYSHPTSPEHEVPNESGPLEVRSIVSVTVPDGMTADEARAAANGN